jgi:hypothetical protein
MEGEAMTNATTDPAKSQHSVEKNIHREEHSLKGTFVSVMLLGGFLVLSWLSVFILFIFRN